MKIDLFLALTNLIKLEFREQSKNPGEYLVKQGDGVLEGIKRAGGYTQNAYPFGGILENEQTAEINAMAAKNALQNIS